MKSVLMRFVVLAGWLFALLAHAQTPDQVLFGPTQYNRTAGAPNVYNGSFSVPASAGAPFQLRIVNGAANGLNRITSGSVKVNGVQVVGPADFGPNVALIERNLALSPGNTLEVRLASAPGGYLTLSVLGTRILPVPTSLAPNPLSITAGASGTLIATLSPSPTQAGALAVSSANAAVATVPATVAFAAGQSTVQIPVTGVADGTTTVTASANGGSASAAVNVTPAPPTVTQLAPATLALTQGSSGALTVTISAAQAGDTTVAVSSSASSIASVPAFVSVPAGQLSAQIAVAALSSGDAQVTASLNGSSASSQVRVTPAPPTVVSLLPAVSTVTLGAGTTLTLTISSAQSADTVVPLAVSPAGLVSAPEHVVVPAGQLTVAVPIGTLAYGQAGITASLNGASASAVVNVVPPPVAVGALEPATFTMNVGATSTFTVRLNSAQTTNTEVELSSSNPSVLGVPASVTVAQGATSATFTATALSTGDALITATANNTSKTSTVHVAPQPAAIVSLLPSPLPLQQGATGSLMVTINVAQEIDTTVALANTDAAVATVPATVVVPAGAISAPIAVNAVSPGTAQITASVNGTSAAATVEVTPPPPSVTALTPATLALPKGTPGVLRVTVSRAPNVATAVALVSTDPAVVSVPVQVNIPAGALFADFPVAANAVGQATITASLNGGSASSVVTISPAELVALTLSPQTPTNYIGEAVPFTATGIMTDGTSEDFTTRVTWTSHDPAVATIASTGVATPLATGATTITATFTYNAVQTGALVIVTQNTVLTVKMPTPLAVTAPATNLEVTQSVTVTVTTTDAPPFGGLVVNLSGSGTGAAAFPPSVTIPEYETSTTFELTAIGAGNYTVSATAQNRLPGTLAFTIVPQFRIADFTPAAGPVGTAVAISGGGFDPNLSGNQVKFNGEPAVIASGSATLLNVIVPPRATTGPITVTNLRGTTSSATPFTVQEREAFDLTLAPAAIQVPPGGFGSTRIRLASTGLNPYPYAASVAISGLPSGITATVDRATVALNQDAIVTFSAAAGATSGGFTITLTATGASGVTTQTVTKTLGVQVLAAGGTTVTGRVLHADDGAPFVGARVRLGGAAVFTDASGTYRFISPPVLGDQVLLIDGNTNNTPQFEFPSGIAMPVMIVAGQDNKVITSYIGRIDATKFTNVVPGQAASVTEADIPSFSLNIQSGQTIIGWDGQPVTKINVRKVPVDRLPIRPIPEGWDTRSVYLFYFFREGGGTPTTPIPVSLPNDLEALPGEQITLWYYDESPTPDPTSNQWRVLGTGTVSQDGKTIVSDPGFGMPKFCCGAVWGGRSGGGNTGNNGGNGCGPRSPNPVDLASGNAMVFRPRPFGISKFMALDPNCHYRSTDARPGLFGRGFSFTYDWFAEQVGLSVRVTNPQGVQFMLAREADGIYRSRSGRSGSIEMEVTPTATGRTLRVAVCTRFEFNPPGRLLAIQDVAGNRTTFELDSLGLLFSMTDPAGKVYEFQTSGIGQAFRINRITDPAGRFIEFTYDTSRRLTSYRDQGGGVTQFGYDAASRISQVTDPRLAVKTIEYDAAGRAVRETLPENAEERYAYTAVGNTVAETRYTNANGNVTTYRFSGLGFGTSVVDALGRVTTTELDPITSLVKRRVDPGGRVTQYFYNTRGDLIRLVDADNKQTLIEYDARFSKPTRIENALGHVVRFTYDAQANLTSVTNAENEVTSFTYTSRGQIETITDPLLRVARFTYDANGNLANSTNPANQTVTRIYDGANRLVELADSLNHAMRFTYDAADRVTEVRNAANGVTKYIYDANDNLLSVTDPNNNPVERHVFDLRNRLKQRTDAKNRSSFFDYDGVGNLIRMTDRKGQITEYAYDALNRLTRLQDHDGRVTTYAYDLAGNLARVSDSLSGDILMSYDLLNRMTEVVTPQGTVSYTYDAIGRRLSRTLSGGDTTTYSYDKIGRLTSVSMRGRTASYTYDVGGRLTERVLPNGIKVSYQYDDSDRMTSIGYQKTDDTPIETITYTYDAAGRRISRSDGQVPPRDTPVVATYDEANRLTTITFGGEAFVLSYDDNGNLVSKVGATSGATTYTWNARDQLVALSAPWGSATFKYDANGRRIERAVNGEVSGFIYDGMQAIAEVKGAAIDTVYHTGISIDEVLARYAASGNHTLLTDALMSVIAQASDDQSITNFYGYSPYGEATALGPDGDNALQFTGRENDRTGLYYYRARYYDPLLKRFISEDPIGTAGGLNLYSYVGGDPVTLTDPTGNVSTCYSAGPGCSGAGSGQIIKTPPGGGCFRAVIVGGYILRWEPCNSPPPNAPLPPPINCPPSPPPPVKPDPPVPPDPAPPAGPGGGGSGSGAAPNPSQCMQLCMLPSIISGLVQTNVSGAAAGAAEMIAMQQASSGTIMAGPVRSAASMGIRSIGVVGIPLSVGDTLITLDQCSKKCGTGSAQSPFTGMP